MRLLILCLLFSLTSCAYFQKKDKHSHVDDKNDDTLICKSRCDNAYTRVMEFSPDANKCVVKYTYPCFPSACDRDKISCRVECSSDKDCAFGAQCNTIEKRCVPAGQYTCQDDWTKVDGVGNQGSCVPYKCNLGQCMNSCVSGSDCAKGFVCEKSVCVLQ